MTIKEFAHKYALTLFWTTVVLAIILLLNLIANCDRYDRRYPGYMMRGGYYNNDDGYYKRGQMMNRQQRPIYNNAQPLEEIDVDITATGTVQ